MQEHHNAPARLFLWLGALNAAVVVAAGAIGAHAFKAGFSEMQTAWYQTAVQYHMFHALGLLSVGLSAWMRATARLATVAGTLMFLGILLFCGSLYAAAITGDRGFAVAAPFGGTSFIVAWILFALSFRKS